MVEPHYQNSKDPVTKETMTDIDIRISSLKGVPSAVLSQLDDLFDGDRERFVDNEEANRRLKPTYRDPYRVPDVV